MIIPRIYLAMLRKQDSNGITMSNKNFFKFLTQNIYKKILVFQYYDY